MSNYIKTHFDFSILIETEAGVTHSYCGYQAADANAPSRARNFIATTYDSYYTSSDFTTGSTAQQFWHAWGDQHHGGASKAGTGHQWKFSTGEIYEKINLMHSCSFVDGPWGGVNSTTPETSSVMYVFKDNKYFDITMTGTSMYDYGQSDINNGTARSRDTGSISIQQKPNLADPVRRVKFWGQKVCDLLGFPEAVWIQMDAVRINSTTGSQNHSFRGDMVSDGMTVTQRFNIPSSADITSNLPFRINPITNEKYLKFMDFRDNSPSNAILIGYQYDLPASEYPAPYKYPREDYAQFKIATTGYIGGGTLSPSAPLHISTSAATVATSSIAAGNENDMAIAAIIETDYGKGAIGFGEPNPTASLHIKNEKPAIILEQTSADFMRIGRQQSTNHWMIGFSTASWSDTMATEFLQFGSSLLPEDKLLDNGGTEENNPYMQIDNHGRVGIGTENTAGYYINKHASRLQLEDKSETTTSSSTSITWEDFQLGITNNTGADNAFAGIAFGVQPTINRNSHMIGAAIKAVREDNGQTDSLMKNALVFETNILGQYHCIERMRLTCSGSLLLAPDTYQHRHKFGNSTNVRFFVDGNSSGSGNFTYSNTGSQVTTFSTTANSSEQVDLILKGARTTSTTTPINTIKFKTNDNNSGGEDLAYIYSYKDLTNTNKGVLTFGTTETNGGSPTERMRISSTGMVCIGATNPDESLYVTRSADDNWVKVGTGNYNARAGIKLDTMRDGSGMGDSQIYKSGSQTVIHTDEGLFFQSNNKMIANINNYGFNVFSSSYQNGLDLAGTSDGRVFKVDVLNKVVGIGTDTPKSKLDVYNNSVYTLEHSASDFESDSIGLYGSVSTANGDYFGGITWHNGTRRRAGISSVMESTDADYVGLAFFTQGTDGPGPMAESMRLSRNGRLGIGTTNPTRTLTVDGAISASGDITNDGNIVSDGGFVGTLMAGASGAPDGYIFRPSNTYIDSWGIKYNEGTPDYIEFRDDTQVTTRIGLDDGRAHFGLDGGNVGIGTPNPTKKLQVAGDISASGHLYLEKNQKIILGSADTHIYANSDATEDLLLAADDDMYLDPDDNLYLRPSDNMYLLGEKHFLKNDNDVYWQSWTWDARSGKGGVSMGDMTDGKEPKGTLHISDSDPTLILQNGAQNQINSGKIIFREGAADGSYDTINRAQIWYDGSNNRLNFDVESMASAMVIQRTSGKVSIGGDEGFFGGALNICRGSGNGGNDSIWFRDTDSNTNAFVFVDEGTSTGTSGGNGFSWYMGDGGIGTAMVLDKNGNLKITADVVAYATSDKRLKKNIIKIDNALDKISQLNGVTFDWKEEAKRPDGENKKSVGLIAQEVQKVLPEVVTEREHNGHLAVNYEQIIPLLVEGIKEQQSQIEDLQDEIKKLKDSKE